MAYTKQTWNDLPNTTSPINATRLNHMEDGIYDVSTTTATTSVAGLMSASDKTHMNRLAVTALLPSAVSTKTTTTLNASVDNFDFIVVLATANAWNHRHHCTLLKGWLYNSMYQTIQFSPTNYDIFIKIYSTTLDTTESQLLGTDSYKISAIYGIKIS